MIFPYDENFIPEYRSDRMSQKSDHASVGSQALCLSCSRRGHSIFTKTFEAHLSQYHFRVFCERETQRMSTAGGCSKPMELLAAQASLDRPKLLELKLGFYCFWHKEGLIKPPLAPVLGASIFLYWSTGRVRKINCY